MTKDNEKYQAYVQILNEELILQWGVRLNRSRGWISAAKAKVVGDVCRTESVSEQAGSIIKNVKEGIIVRNSNHCIKRRSSRGIGWEDAEKELELSPRVTEEEDKKKSQNFLNIQRLR